MQANVSRATAPRISTGVIGLDEVLLGGLIAGRTYLLTGPPGGGKTTLGWHFLTAGVALGEPVLFITFGEPEAELRANAEASGFETTGVAFVDLSPSPDLFEKMRTYDIFSASEVELEPTTEKIMAGVNAVKPKRIFVDSMTHLRYLARDDNEFRRQTLSFSRFLRDQGACVLITSEACVAEPDDDLRFLCDGVIELGTGVRARSLAVTKFRGSDYRAGNHAMRLSDSGALVFPRLLPERHSRPFLAEPLPWGIAELDVLLHGGIERGTVTMLTGPSGVGKTTVGVHFLKEAATRGERSAVYTFDERAETLLRRCEGINIPIREMTEHGDLSVVEIEALRYSPDEFANLVRRDVEEHGTKIVMIDSVSGYKMSVAGEDIAERLHALCKYLVNVGVTVLLVNELQEISDFRVSEIGISYLADNVLYLRYLERRSDRQAKLGRAIGVLKKRLSDFEKTLREFSFSPSGVEIGVPLDNFGGILPSTNGVT